MYKGKSIIKLLSLVSVGTLLVSNNILDDDNSDLDHNIVSEFNTIDGSSIMDDIVPLEFSNEEFLINNYSSPELDDQLNSKDFKVSLSEVSSNELSTNDENEDYDYEHENDDISIEVDYSNLSKDELVDKVISGELGNSDERRVIVESSGYDYEVIQEEVNNILLVEDDELYTEDEQLSNNETSSVSSNSSNVVEAYPHGSFKSYMRWTILSPNSPQGQLSAKSTACSNTSIMMYEGRYLVALGYAYADEIGQHIDIVMDSGEVIKAIVGDWKAEQHTDEWNSASLNNGSIVEFVVSSNEDANRTLNGSGNYDSIFPGTVNKFIKY